MDVADLGNAKAGKSLRQPLQADVDSPDLHISRLDQDGVRQGECGQPADSPGEELPSGEPASLLHSSSLNCSYRPCQCGDAAWPGSLKLKSCCSEERQVSPHGLYNDAEDA